MGKKDSKRHRRNKLDKKKTHKSHENPNGNAELNETTEAPSEEFTDAVNPIVEETSVIDEFDCIDVEIADEEPIASSPTRDAELNAPATLKPLNKDPSTPLLPPTTPPLQTAEIQSPSATLPQTATPSLSPSAKPSTSKAALNKKTIAKAKTSASTNVAAATTTATIAPTTTSSNSKKSKKRRESGTSSEEERWLNAIESGKLEEDVEVKKMKNPKLMTARQRAMYERNNDSDLGFPVAEMLLSLPTGYREKEKPQTAEEIQKAEMKILRRRQQADEKREKEKKRTMERLLKKQESRQRSGRSKIVKIIQPMIVYKNTMEGASLQMPEGFEFPLQAQRACEPPKVQLCGIAGCGKAKVYNCSKTNLPLCSFACYRKNVQNIRQIMC